VKPVKGSAVFFSYINPETKVMDDGFTEHSGCPVFEGEKKIVTQWVRLGVDDENSWDTFNTREYLIVLIVRHFWFTNLAVLSTFAIL
jgi:hypothetical protein